MLKEMFEFLKNYKALVVPWVATFLGIGFILSTRMDLMQKLLWEAVLLDAFIISMLAFAPLPRRAKTFYQYVMMVMTTTMMVVGIKWFFTPGILPNATPQSWPVWAKILIMALLASVGAGYQHKEKGG